MADKKNLRKTPPPLATGYDAMLSGVVELLEQARRTSARAVNTIMTATYWEIGRRIVEYEQLGKNRADYGKQVINLLAADLTAKLGRGFGRSNLFQMRQFYTYYPNIAQTMSAQSENQIIQTLSGQLAVSKVAACFTLPWSHYVHLLSVDNLEARRFYETEALRGGWSVRQLDRQISTLFYERTALSRNKAAMLKKGEKPLPEDAVTPEEEIKDPLVLEFLGLKDEYSENDFEEALILAHYALENLPNKVLAAQYKTVLPDEKALVAEIDKTRKELETRRQGVKK